MANETWVQIGHFSRYQIMALENRRRLVDPQTGEVIREYTVPVKSGNETQTIMSESHST